MTDKSRAGGVDAAPTTGKPKQIAEELRSLIVGGHFEEGDSLGTETALLARFQVSRPSLREALRILEAEGLVSVVRGVLGGVVVHQPNQRMTARTAALLLSSRNVSLEDVFEASAIIEPAAVRLVAVSRTRRRAAKRLGDLIIEQKQMMRDPVLTAGAFHRFHEEIIILAGNQTLIVVKQMLDEVIARAMADLTARSKLDSITVRRRSIRSHEMLAALIEKGDGDAAQAHWNTHMAHLRGWLLGDRGSSVINLSDHR